MVLELIRSGLGMRGANLVGAWHKVKPFSPMVLGQEHEILAASQRKQMKK